jgi:hypothetical protein
MKQSIFFLSFVIFNLSATECHPENMEGKTKLILSTNQPVQLVLHFRSINKVTGEHQVQTKTIITSQTAASHLCFSTKDVSTFLESIECRPIHEPYCNTHKETCICNPPLELTEKTKTNIRINVSL